MKRTWKQLGEERGQSLVEFSLVSIVLFITVLGMIDVGRAVWNYNTLAQATREGARYAIVHGANADDPAGPGDDQQVITAVEKHAPGLQGDNLTVQVEWPSGTNDVGEPVKVTTTYQFQPSLNLLGIGPFEITSSSTMRIRN